MTWIVGAVIVWIVPIVVAYKLGHARGREGLGYGILLGWAGVLILFLLPRRADGTYLRECPHCRELMRVGATVCPHCQQRVEPETAAVAA